MSEQQRLRPADGLVDFAGSLPSAQRMALEIQSLFAQDGYSELFGERWANVLGVPIEIVRAVGELPPGGGRRQAVALVEPHAASLDQIVARYRAAGIAHTVIHNLLPTPGGMTNAELAEALAPHAPDLIGFVRIDPAQLERSLAEADECILSAGFRGITLTPFWHRLRADDPVLDPLYEFCLDRGLVAYIHTSINWARSIPLDFEHPLFIDRVATRFPDLTIVAGHGGWPWVPDMVAVTMRHPNVYIDFSAFRPRHLATPGTGWDMLWYYLQRTLQDKVVFGSTWSLLGRPLEEVLDEVRSIGLDSTVLDKFTRTTAARLLALDGPAHPIERETPLESVS